MRQIYVVLTETCNLACTHCIRESSPYVKTAMSLDEAMAVFDDIDQTFPEAEVLLTGGEPTVHRDFSLILERALRSGRFVMINSNGLTPFFQPQRLERYAGFDQLAFQISIDGHEEQHDRVRGAGTFRRSVDTLERLCSSGFRTCASATVMNEAFMQGIGELLVELDHLGLGHIAIKRATYAGRAASGDDITTARWNQWVQQVRSMGTKTRLHISPMFDFEALDQLDRDTLEALSGNVMRNCGSGTEKLYIYPNLDVCACTCFKKLPMGNLNEASLQAIISSFQAFEVESEVCSGCRYLTLCRGGCLGSGYQHTGSMGSPDPRCPKVTVSQGTASVSV